MKPCRAICSASEALLQNVQGLLGILNNSKLIQIKLYKNTYFHIADYEAMQSLLIGQRRRATKPLRPSWDSKDFEIDRNSGL